MVQERIPKCSINWSSVQLVQIWVQTRMLDISLNWIARSSAKQRWQKCRLCNSPTQRLPSKNLEPFAVKFIIGHWPSGTDMRQSSEKLLREAQRLVKTIFVSASHQTGHSIYRRSIIVGNRGEEIRHVLRPETRDFLDYDFLDHLVQCWPDEPSLTWTQIRAQTPMPNYGLNWIAISIAIQSCQWCSSPTQREPSWSYVPFSFKSAIEYWPSGADTRQSAGNPLRYFSMSPPRQDLTQC